MKYSFSAIFPALVLCFTLLFTACAPTGSMNATLTQLPFVATPPTLTPLPTRTPRTGITATPSPPGYEATLTRLSSTPAPTSPPTATVTIRVSCSPGSYDETVPGPDTPEQYIGLHYDPDNLPTQITLLDNGDIKAGSTNWARVRVEDREMYWIQKVACRDERGLPYWEIADALTLPLLDGQGNEAAVDLCFYGTRKLANVIAYGTYDPAKPAEPVTGDLVGWPVQVMSAWELKERFVPIGTQGLTCILQKPGK